MCARNCAMRTLRVCGCVAHALPGFASHEPPQLGVAVSAPGLVPVLCARERAGKSARQLQSYIQFLWSLPGTILGLILLARSHTSLPKAVTTFLQLVTTFPSGWKRSQRRRSMLLLSQMPCLKYMYMYAVYLYGMA